MIPEPQHSFGVFWLERCALADFLFQDIPAHLRLAAMCTRLKKLKIPFQEVARPGPGGSARTDYMVNLCELRRALLTDYSHARAGINKRLVRRQLWRVQLVIRPSDPIANHYVPSEDLTSD